MSRTYRKAPDRYNVRHDQTTQCAAFRRVLRRLNHRRDMVALAGLLP